MRLEEISNTEKMVFLPYTKSCAHLPGTGGDLINPAKLTDE
jgi:hypothetical protein